MLVERSKLNARQKRTMFRDRFGEILLPAGFIYRENRFARVHPGECLLLVELQLGRTNAYVRFDAIPLCHRERLQTPAAGCRVDTFYKLSGLSFEQYYLKAFEDGRLEAQLGLFRRFVMEGLLQIRTNENLLAFENEVLLPALPNSRWHDRLLESLQQRNYNAAMEHIRSLREHTLSCIRAEEENMRFSLQCLDTPRQRAEAEQSFARYLEITNQSLQLCSDWEQRIVQGNYPEISAILAENIAAADACCRERWPEFYEE